jgi:ATP-dependent helicase YprA (DUF1998 family)
MERENREFLKCGNNNEPLDKAGAAFLLREMLKRVE